MKKRAIVLFFFLLSAGINLQAQNNATPFQFGFRVAPNLGWLKPDNENYSRHGISGGFSWGFVGEYSFSQTYAICTGFTITSNAGRLKYPDRTIINTDTIIGSMNRKYKIRSLEIPVVFKMRTKEIGYFTYYGVIGFGTSFNMKATAEDEFTADQPSGTTIKHEPDVKSKINFLRESLIIGLGVQYNISGNTQAFAGLNFNNGFTDILKGNGNVNPYPSEKAISNYIELSVGVLF